MHISSLLDLGIKMSHSFSRAMTLVVTDWTNFEGNVNVK